MNLKEKIAKAFSAWDTNKSIWENLKNIGGIIKNAVVEWWETSPFKVLWDTKVWPMIEPFVKSLTDLKNRIVNAFKGWDSSKSIWDNLKNIASTIKDAIIEWWNDDKNPIKAVYNKYIAPIVGKIRDIVAPIIEKIKAIWNSLKNKLSKVYIHIPVWDKDIYPFAALVNEPFLRNGGESAADAKTRIDKENIDEKLKKIAALEKDIATDNYWGGDHEVKKQRDREKIAALRQEIDDYKKSSINSTEIV